MDEHIAKSDPAGRARLRQTALELFAERGFEATSTRAVAAAAGFSPALVTRHFGSKQGLREAVDAHVLDLLAQRFNSLGAEGDLMSSLGRISTEVFGADPVLRGYLRHALLEGGEAGAQLFGRLLRGAHSELLRLSEAYGDEGLDGEGPDAEWAAFQMLCLVLGPLLLERVMQPNLTEPMFEPAVLSRCGEANQQLLLRGYYGRLEHRER
ncbi:helix-turn-helix domain-containing protein [Streptomyces sp. NPDC004539]|uniref:TetR/AcrR family transcriptional regulator n=1 Tax=Streptomyces sp. NPDC004539 TaxID=3154280 RepID=UPI0033A014E1